MKKTSSRSLSYKQFHKRYNDRKGRYTPANFCNKVKIEVAGTFFLKLKKCVSPNFFFIVIVISVIKLVPSLPLQEHWTRQIEEHERIIKVYWLRVETLFLIFFLRLYSSSSKWKCSRRRSTYIWITGKCTSRL